MDHTFRAHMSTSSNSMAHIKPYAPSLFKKMRRKKCCELGFGKPNNYSHMVLVNQVHRKEGEGLSHLTL
jgi:hypothetical protein